MKKQTIHYREGDEETRVTNSLREIVVSPEGIVNLGGAKIEVTPCSTPRKIPDEVLEDLAKGSDFHRDLVPGNANAYSVGEELKEWVHCGHVNHARTVREYHCVQFYRIVDERRLK